MRSAVIVLFFCGLVNLTAAVFANENIPRSLTFADAAALAVSYSADLRQNRSSLALREGAWVWGLRAYFPRVSLTVSENDRLQQIGADSFIKNYGIGLDQLVWDGGKTSLSRKLEQMELRLASAAVDRMESEIAEAAISAYRNVLSSREILKIKKDALAVLEEQRRILNEEVLLGLALAVDLAGADINLSEAKLDLYSLQLDLDEMERQFAELLGLDELPFLSEKIDTSRSVVFPAAEAIAALARERNPDLKEAQFSITKKQAELKLASNSWIPSFKLVGNFGLSGQTYPLTRYNWSIGINIDFSGPWIQNRIAAQAGWEAPNDKTALVQNTLNPLPEPAQAFGKKQAALALALEREKYRLVLERFGRIAANAVEKCALHNQKRILALDAAALAGEKCRVEEIKLQLGQITRVDLMETIVEQTQKEIAVVETVIALLAAERELEKFLDLKPGELALFADYFSSLINNTNRRNYEN